MALQSATDTQGSRRLRESLWKREETSALAETTIGDALRSAAERVPSRLAFVGNAHGSGEERRLTYAQLLDEARRVAAALGKLARHGEYVALWAPNVIEWPIVLYGAALAGVTLVAVNPTFRGPELEYILKHSGAVALVHADISRDYRMADVVAEVAPRCPSLRAVASLSELDRWRVPAAEAIDESSFGPAAHDPHAVAMLQYSSGTTGRPKGVLLRHRSLFNNARLTMQELGAREGFVGVNPLPMFHTAACVIGTLGPLSKLGTSVLVEKFSGLGVLDLIERERASVLFYVPTVLAGVIEATKGRANVPPLDIILGGASNVPSTLVEAAERTFGARVHNLWGMTELSPVTTLTRTSDTREDQLRSVGRPMPQVDIRVVDVATRRQTLPVGEEGELCARGYQVMVEYLGDPDATAIAIDEDGWLHTGDLGKMDERGVVTLTGRLKELIIRGGENIAPAEIESHLVADERIYQAAVVGIPDERWGEVVGAVLLLRAPAEAGLREDLVSRARAALAPFKVPSQWFVATELPLTASGKVQKFVLRDQIVGGKLTPLA